MMIKLRLDSCSIAVLSRVFYVVDDDDDNSKIVIFESLFFFGFKTGYQYIYMYY